jgi:hypothetical protein
LARYRIEKRGVFDQPCEYIATGDGQSHQLPVSREEREEREVHIHQSGEAIPEEEHNTTKKTDS